MRHLDDTISEEDSDIDEFSRLPEVEIVESTAADAVLPRLDRILSTHDIPERIKSDNGPPFNSQDMKTYAAKRGFKHQRIIPEQPSSNGLAENFMRMLLKVAHTAFIDQNDPREAVFRYLMTHRATPHSSTGKTPAEMLYNRPINTTIPILQTPSPHFQARTRLQEQTTDQRVS